MDLLISAAAEMFEMHFAWPAAGKSIDWDCQKWAVASGKHLQGLVWACFTRGAIKMTRC